MNISLLIENTYNKLLGKILDDNDSDEMSDLIVEYQDELGKTVRFSWKERNERLRDREKES